MKIRILTIHHGRNHGSALQAYALNFYLRKRGYEVLTINYKPQEHNDFTNYKKVFSTYSYFLIVLRYILCVPSRIIKNYPFKKFLNKHVPMTNYYNKLSGNEPDIKDANLYIVGSDQIWNYDYNIPGDYSYLGDFVGESSPLVSYAASFGKEDIGLTELKEYEYWFKRFQKISVREKTGISILNKLNITSECVLDPTFLLDKETWKSFISSKQVKRFQKRNFLVVYVIDALYDEALNYAKEIATYMEWDVYLISFKHIRDSRIKRQFNNISPKTFVALINSAKFVVTNSFHGTIFSINLNKQFISIAKDKYNTRIKSILEDLDLTNRYVETRFDLEMVLSSIDYNIVNDKLDLLRRHSESYIDEILHLVK